jgi:nuclear pore complex protein Nup93
LLRAARQSEREKHVNEAIKLYYLAGDHETVVACLARALGDYIGDADDGGSEGAVLSETAKEILKHYERTNKGAGRSRDAVVKLVKIREARSAKNARQLEKALEVCTHIESVL